MLFYNQLKKEFGIPVWKRGQEYFRQNRVRNVRLEGNRVLGRVEGSDHGVYETVVSMARGTIESSECNCAAHGARGVAHCRHVAALSIWIVERGSLLRMGRIGLEAANAAVNPARKPPKASEDADGEADDADDGARSETADDDDDHGDGGLAPRAAGVKKKNPVDDAVEAEAVTFVRGVFQNRILSAVSAEPALRFRDPTTGKVEVLPTTRLVALQDAGAWKTVGGVMLRAPHRRLPIIDTVTGARVAWQGQISLERLADLLAHPERDLFVFHESVDTEVEPDPLKLVSMQVGRRTDKSRLLTYEFANQKNRFTSDELKRLSALGRLSNRWLWAENKLYRFETPLSQLSQYANRTGVAVQEGAPGTKAAAAVPDGYGHLYDDGEAHALHPIAMFRLQLELGVDQVHVDPEWKEFHDWLATFEKKRIPSMPAADYGFDLRDYQVNGLTWMWSLYQRGLSSLLADDMGLGKTHQLLALLTTLYKGRARKDSPRPLEPSLVVAPTSVVAAWIQKLKKYDTGLNWQVYHGNTRKKPEPGTHLVLTTYGMLQREEVLREQQWHVVVLDEAQAVKNATTISSRTARLLKSRFRVAMTGTPVENQSTDLWSIMEFLLPGYLGSLPRFKRLYGTGREAPTADQAQALRRLVSPFLLRRTKSQVLKELPEKTEEMVSCQLAPAQRKAYRAALATQEAVAVRDNLASGGKIDYANVLALLTRLKQICDHPKLAFFGASGKHADLSLIDPLETGKWEALEELIREALASDLKVVIFTQYLGMIDLISHWLTKNGIGHAELRGDTQDRGARLERFANDPECKIFVCSLLAGGLGIDLTSASVCIHYDRWWNPAKENQATDRLHRIGQTRGVQVFKLQIPGTVEDRIAEIIRSKLSLSDALIEESSLGLKSFSREELLVLLSPPPEHADEADI